MTPQIKCKLYNINNRSKMVEEKYFFFADLALRNDEEYVPENLANLSEQPPDRLKNLSRKLAFWRKDYNNT